MEELKVFINKEEIEKLYNEEKYRNCMDKKYFEYIISTGKKDYIDKYLNDSKYKQLIERSVAENKVVKVMDKISVVQNKKRYIGELENSGICNIEVSDDLVKKYPKQLLLGGVFALITLEENMDEEYPYYIEEIEVLEDIDVNLEDYKKYFSEKVKEYREHKKTGNSLISDPKDLVLVQK
jgi:predicted ATP-dependent Lon-type protease